MVSAAAGAGNVDSEAALQPHEGDSGWASARHPSLPSSCETASPVGLLSLRAKNWSTEMLDLSKQDTVAEIAHRVPQVFCV